MNINVMNSYQLTFATYDKLAQVYQDKFMNLQLYNDTYDRFCDLIKNDNASILEIGCGPGNITKYILSKKPDSKILAIDMAPNMLKLAEKNNPAASFKLMDCRNIDQIETKFDAIICGFCMPYLSKNDCIKFIEDAYNLLNNNGILYFSTIEGDYNKSNYEVSSNGEHKVFVYYYSQQFLEQQLCNNNFKLVDVTHKAYPSNQPTSTHLIFIAEKVVAR